MAGASGGCACTAMAVTIPREEDNAMLSLDASLRTRSDELVAKVLDGEALVINVATGVYYSMGGPGALIWERIEAGYRLRDIAAGMAALYDIEPERAEADVLQLAMTLAEEKLVEPSDAETLPAELATDFPAPATYESPKVEIYRDIGHLVALDPPMPGLRDLPWKGPTDESST